VVGWIVLSGIVAILAGATHSKRSDIYGTKEVIIGMCYLLFAILVVML
jgi:hypothetical protein